MKLYVVVEGSRTEVEVIPSWIYEFNSDMAKLDSPKEEIKNSYYIAAGRGYPAVVRSTLESAVLDVNQNPDFSDLAVVVDCEDDSRQIRLDEVNRVLLGMGKVGRIRDGVNIHIITPSPSIEAWILGNRKFICLNPTRSNLKEFIDHYNVASYDPECITLGLNYTNRAKLCFGYVKQAFRERGIVYSKSSPGEACKRHYLMGIIDRFEDGDIATFGDMMNLLRRVGANNSSGL